MKNKSIIRTDSVYSFFALPSFNGHGIRQLFCAGGNRSENVQSRNNSLPQFTLCVLKLIRSKNVQLKINGDALKQMIVSTNIHSYENLNLIQKHFIISISVYFKTAYVEHISAYVEYVYWSLLFVYFEEIESFSQIKGLINWIFNFE